MDKHTGMAAMIRSTLWDLGLPTATYYALHLAGVGDTAALMGAPARPAYGWRSSPCGAGG